MRLMSGGKGRTPQRAAVDEDGALLLALEPGDERLPWLEGEDDDEEPDFDRGRALAVIAAALLVLLLLASLAWWLLAGRADPELAADGSTIEAPDGPYKVRPQDPGGREVLGTGDTSFAVAEGRSVEVRIASQKPAPPPAEQGDGGAESASEQVPGIGVQIGAYPTREAAQAGWAQLSQRLEPLRGRGHRILEGSVDSASVYRLQVVAENEAAARQLCSLLRTQGGDCQVKR